MNTIQENTLAEIVNQNFRAASVFEKYGLDFCCGGKKSLAKACAEKNLPPEEIVTKLQDAMKLPARGAQSFGTMTLAALIDHILEKHHTYVKASLEMISFHTQKVARVHGKSNPGMVEVAELFQAIKQDLIPHLEQEEQILFPAIKALEQEQAPQQDIKSLLAVLQRDHEAAGAAFSKIRTLTENYQPPLNACNTWKVSYAELQEFEKDLHQHVHLENNILYPKALALLNQV